MCEFTRFLDNASMAVLTMGAFLIILWLFEPKKFEDSY